ncbi:phage protein NinX family protein [Cupriavidus sp. UYPR2.512]|uniref:phage protein NinX family protein n=1 Tax=Cupriavidus sp. UYPR2.512 TaxID=1080187 RepID=UPI000361E0E9|nr:phage protein NinX family protein [Cupriavidus sp. UYPR2.512]UIF90939.1 DUF2591 domain-containing protein [Cupriavidus necator]
MLASDLEGALLDYWVARAEGIEHPPYLRAMAPGCVLVPRETESDGALCRDWVAYQPSLDWAVGGPILDRERIGVMPRNGEWAAWSSGEMDPNGAGETALIAGMRAYVSSRFGKEVSDL